ncbi:MAG: hypothetical protein A3D67_01810 [Candidatus Lloydbacteria bacterium RIFCSPHIGHO2_02_FULL_51_22]|uniref:Uncharacterized protein n=3 Tax=Candidatus Lloydiibacteriota TaxID=1817910 RepID=A0A1G2DAS3_9BACT|nr:MAG: hypothetical protein A3D67_01810 [Candidatus Lloydbacteria bacterium RIFCSPHIGHO2_02_FULL_51_22]OGZ14524.1 MAG: hypothetical protein A3J08_02340 [Candidatus Lloydbacteria bacterium RIFCSPLOWO2_02_FULL_51_11]OGZ16475.1 MAG: hypothetical protein A3G11_02810 [Candidatus Lloydbacteria bacterium RIFCSPLOWO2_12_FULL_51_9]
MYAKNIGLAFALATGAFVAETETSVNLFFIILGIAVLLMLVSNIFFWRGSFVASGFATAVAVLAAVFAAVFAALATAFAAADIAGAGATFVAALAALAAGAFAKEKKAYRIASGIFYVITAFSGVVVFYS